MPEQMKSLYNLEQAQTEAEKIREKASSFAKATADKREISGGESVGKEDYEKAEGEVEKEENKKEKFTEKEKEEFNKIWEQFQLPQAKDIDVFVELVKNLPIKFHKKIALGLIEIGKGDYVADMVESFYVNHNKIAKQLISNGEIKILALALRSNRKFHELSNEIATKLIAAGYEEDLIKRLDSFNIDDNLIINNYPKGMKLNDLIEIYQAENFKELGHSLRGLVGFSFEKNIKSIISSQGNVAFLYFEAIKKMGYQIFSTEDIECITYVAKKYGIQARGILENILSKVNSIGEERNVIEEFVKEIGVLNFDVYQEFKIAKIENNTEDIAEIKEKTSKERKLIENIKQMIANKQICSHSPYYILNEILKGKEKHHLGKNLIDILQSYFENGIWSLKKMARSKNIITRGRGYGPASQIISESLGGDILKIILTYIQKQKDSGVKSENINYDEMLNDHDFKKDISNKFLNKTLSLYNESLLDHVTEEWLNSPRARFAFVRLKQKDFQKRWEDELFGDESMNEEDEKTHGSFKHLLDILYGNNLISSIAPEYLKEIYLETGEIRKGEYDSLSILFRKPDKIHTHPLIVQKYGEKEKILFDLGVANKIPVKNFIAVVINKEIKKLPKEVLDVIPKDLPIISTDFRVIRMSKIIKNKEKKRRIV